MNRAFLRANPSELAFEREALPKAAEVGDYLVILRAYDQMLQCADGGDYNFVAAAERERHAVGFDAIARVGGQDYVGRRIVGVGMHGVRAGERSGCRGSNVAD